MDALAEECRRRAAVCSGYLRTLFEELAENWAELAQLRRRIEADRVAQAPVGKQRYFSRSGR
jgi:hypothetical protein